jgi:hypothetical protein
VPHWSPGNGRNIIDASDLTFTAVCDSGDSACAGTVEIFTFRSPQDKDKTWSEFWPEAGVCCTEQMVAESMYVSCFFN